jgi:hypothetical protein
MNNIILEYKDYLTEQKLFDLFVQLNKERKFELKSNKKLENGLIGDIVVDTYKNKYLIEFDGYRHFNDPKTIIRDHKKDEYWLSKFGTEVIRIPYFMQLGGKYGCGFKSMFYLLLKDIDALDIIVNNDYPNGFIDSKALLPGGFCTLGIKSFEKYMEPNDEKFKEIFHEEVIKSLIQKKRKINKDILFYEGFEKKYSHSLLYFSEFI